MRAPSTALALALAACAASPVGERPRERDAAAPPTAATPLPVDAPSAPAPAAPPFAGVDLAIRAAVARGDVPGAVCVVVHRGAIVARVAVGERAPREPMTIDTVFDLASLTKPLATGLAVMQLVDARRVQLDAKVRRYVPAFGDDDVTVEELLLHTSGLPADSAIAEWKGGRAEAIERALATPLEAAPGARVRYSDLGFVALGALVERVSGQRLDAFVRRRTFEPLGLVDTTFRPDAELAARAAPTEARADRLLRGEVHDPRAAALDGVAGHAGLFSTASDLASLGAAILDVARTGRRRDGLPSARVLRDMLRPRVVPGGARALAWDVAASLSPTRGAVALSHTGFTGTAITIDPSSDTVVVLLSSRLQAGAGGDAKPMRHDVLDAVRAGIAAVDGAPRSGVRAGVDVLVEERFSRFADQRVGLVTNDAVVDRDGVTTARRFAEAHVHVARVFTPEHGASAHVEGAGDGSVDAATGAPVTRLFGAHARPTAADLDGLDVIAVDLPNVGARFFTYVTTLGLVLEAAAERHVPVVVLDRPPLVPVDRAAGPLLDDDQRGFTGYDRLPVAFAMTNGELARMFAVDRARGVSLSVVAMDGYSRARAADELGAEFVAPSPNLRRVEGALLYAGVALLERTNVSVGRGTDRAFELVGAPWIDAAALTRALAHEALPGARATSTAFTPRDGPFAGQSCSGVAFRIVDRAALRPVDVGLAIARALARSQGNTFRAGGLLPMLGGHTAFDALVRGATVGEIDALGAADLAAFARRRAPALLYP